MPYPIEMRDSLNKVASTRNSRVGKEFRRLEFSEKDDILQNYHPDFRKKGKTEIPYGPNKGELIPNELAELLTSPSRLDIKEVDLEKVDFETDVLVIKFPKTKEYLVYSITGMNSNFVTSTRPRSDRRSSGITTKASRLNCIFGLFILQPHWRKPASTEAACSATSSALRSDIIPAIGKFTNPITLPSFTTI